VKVKVARGLIPDEGTVDDSGSVYNATIGCWMPLEATDTLSMSDKHTWPFLGEFKATYDPDAKWKVLFIGRKRRKLRKDGQMPTELAGNH